MAQTNTTLEEASLDQLLAKSQGTFDPEMETPADDDPETTGEFQGHPAQETTEETTEETENPPESTTPAPPPVEPPPAPETPPSPPVDAEAERRRLEAERRMHQATEEASLLRQKQEKLEQEVATLKEQASSGPSTPKGEERRKTARQQLRAKMQELSALETSQADYWDRLSDHWADGLDPVIRAVAEEVLEQRGGQPLNTEALVSQITTAVLAQVEAKTEERRIFDYIVGQAKDAGFDVGGQSQDAQDFWGLVMGHVDNTMPDGTLEAKTTEAVTIMKRLKGVESVTPEPTPTPTPPPSQTPRQVPIRQPMGRSGAQAGAAPRTGAGEDTREFSLEDAIQSTHGKGRV